MYQISSVQFINTIWLNGIHISKLMFVMLLLLKECFLYCRNKTFLCEALKQPNRWTRTWPRILMAVFLLLLTTFKHPLFERKYVYTFIYETTFLLQVKRNNQLYCENCGQSKFSINILKKGQRYDQRLGFFRDG